MELSVYSRFASHLLQGYDGKTPRYRLSVQLTRYGIGITGLA